MARLSVFTVTWVWPGVIMSPWCDRGLGRCVGRHGGAGGEVAGVGAARAGSGLVAGVGGPRTCASDDRCVRAGVGRVPARV
jgi:hypothetical protein